MAGAQWKAIKSVAFQDGAVAVLATMTFGLCGLSRSTPGQAACCVAQVGGFAGHGPKKNLTSFALRNLIVPSHKSNL